MVKLVVGVWWWLDRQVEGVLENAAATSKNDTSNTDWQLSLVELKVKVDLLLFNQSGNRLDIINSVLLNLATLHFAFIEHQDTIRRQLTQHRFV